ncbi:MAG TPA: glycosyltransferase family 39 protein [Chthoniobacterales bacterium]|nr:glycosyltransferase family 39 protein [Chthoniobacterales bacterium]
MRGKIESHDKLIRIAWWVLAATVLGLTIAIRIRLLGIPLERDEGEYAYAGQLMLQGIPPYRLAYNMKFPGTYAAYAVIMSIFGQTITGIHMGLLLVNAASVALIFFLGRRLVNSTAGLAAAASYAFLSVSPVVRGFAAHATHFVMLPVLGGALLLLYRTHRQAFTRLFGSGLLFGLGVLMKQPAVFFILFGATYLFARDIRERFPLKTIFLRNLIFGAGVILPFGITCLLLWHAGAFDKFWFWTMDYARQYGSLVPQSEALRIFVYNAREVIGTSWALWALAGIQLIAGLWNRRMRSSTAFLLGLLAFSALALSVGFYFRYHYFILVLPAVSLLAGAAIAEADHLLVHRARSIRIFALVIAAGAMGLQVFRERELLFRIPVDSIPRYVYGLSPFAESIPIAKYLREHTTPNDTIAILGSEPQIYFYSNRHSATGYIYTYGLMEPQKYAGQMQCEMIREIEVARPKYLIIIAMEDSWTRWHDSKLEIFNWATKYSAQNYTAVGFVNIVGADHTDYFFGNIPASVMYLKDYILIYERKS